MIYIEFGRGYRNAQARDKAKHILSEENHLCVEWKGQFLTVPYDDGEKALELLAKNGFRKYTVVYKQYDDVENAVFDAAQALCPFKIQNDPRATAYLISVIADAMKGVSLTVREDVIAFNNKFAANVEYWLKCNLEDFELGEFDDSIHPREDDDLLCEAGDQIDNAAFNAINALSTKKLDWDMYYIGHVITAIEAALESFEVPVCHPWQDDEECICYSLPTERCEHCLRARKNEKYFL